MVQKLEGMRFTEVPFGQGYKDIFPYSKELMKITLEKKLVHGGNSVLRRMVDNIYVKAVSSGNNKPDKEKTRRKLMEL